MNDVLRKHPEPQLVGSSDRRSGACDVCVVTYNNEHTIGRLLRSLAAEPAVRRVLILDNASSDATVAAVERFRESSEIEVVLERSPTNCGFPAGVNQLLRRTQAPTVAVLNPDIELRDQALTKLSRAVTEDRSIGIATCQLRTLDGRPQSEPARPKPSALRVALGYLPAAVRRPLRALAGYRRGLALDQAHDVASTMGALMVFRAPLLSSVGYLDESVFMYLEDLDFAERVRRSGLRIRYEGGIWVWHDSGTSARGSEAALGPLMPQAWLAFFARYGSPTDRVLARPLLIVICAGRALGRLTRRQPPRGEIQALRQSLVYRPAREPRWSADPGS